MKFCCLLFFSAYTPCFHSILPDFSFNDIELFRPPPLRNAEKCIAIDLANAFLSTCWDLPRCIVHTSRENRYRFVNRTKFFVDKTTHWLAIWNQYYLTIGNSHLMCNFIYTAWLCICSNNLDPYYGKIHLTRTKYKKHMKQMLKGIMPSEWNVVCYERTLYIEWATFARRHVWRSERFVHSWEYYIRVRRTRLNVHHFIENEIHCMASVPIAMVMDPHSIPYTGDA